MKSIVFRLLTYEFTIGAAFIGREYAIASAPPISGGVVAGIIMQEAAVFGSLTAATPQMIESLAFPIVGALLIGVVGIAIFAIIAGKIVKASPYMAIAIGCTALFGFPGTFILSNEVANAVGSTEEEKKYVLDNILPPMLVAGFITVTIGSVIFAGIMAPMLV